MFSPQAKITTQLSLNYTISGLAKLLLFEHFVRAQSNGNTTAYIIAESEKYPYKLKKKPSNKVITFTKSM